MAEEKSNLSEFNKFVESVKAKIPVNELYTKLTGEQFEKIDARYRARIVWREDRTPSLSYYAGENILTDFTDRNPKTGHFRGYNPLDLLIKCGGAVTFSHALQMACKIADVEIPDSLSKTNADGVVDKRAFYVGPKLLEVWNACQSNLEDMIKNQHKRPINMVRFFESRNIPFSLEFCKAVNIGICPSYSITHGILNDTGILKQGKGKELNIHTEDMSNNAIVFPLYNINGALCGLRFRRFDQKDFAQWIPVETPCFFNMNRFRNRPTGRRTLLVEGEMNLIAYARSVYNEVKDKENLQQNIEDALTIIYATGSKDNALDIFNSELNKVLYIQDHDVKDCDEVPNPRNHPILTTCNNIANQINADDLLVVDWESLPYATNKYDIEEYFKYHEFKLASIRDLPTISLPRYAFKVIKKYVNSIQNEDNKRENQIKFTFLVADMLQNAQRRLFEEIAEKEFNLSSGTTASLRNHDRNIAYGEYSIDPLGRIIQTTTDDHGTRIYPKTNFYLRITNEITYYNLNNSTDKFYEVEIVIGGSQLKKNLVPSGDIVDDKKMKEFSATTGSLTDLEYIDPDFRGKSFNVVTGLMATIPTPKKTYVFSSLGRPYEEVCCDYFKSEKFYLFPRVSVINGKTVKNEEMFFDVNIQGRGEKVKDAKFNFREVDDDEFRKLGGLFWNHLRYTNNTNIIDSCIGMVFDSCTREMQGEGIVENEHGFPIYLSGQSGSYKTTAAIAAMCLLGDFTKSSDLLSWNATVLSLTHQLTTIGSCVHCLDDLKVEEMRSSDFTSFFHNIYGGPTRTRMDSTGSTIRGGNKLTCSLIVTAETQASDIPESIAARILILRVKKPASDIAQECKYHLDIMQSVQEDGKTNYNLMSGFLPRVIAWAQNRGIRPYAESVKKWKKAYMEILEEHKNNAERPSDMVARIVAAFEQVCTFCKENEICTDFEADAAFQRLVEYWNAEILNQIHRIETHSSTYKVVDILCQIIEADAVGIKVYHNNSWKESKRFFANYPICDITYPDNGERKLIIVSSKALLNIMNNYTENGHCIVQDKFIEDLKETGIIEVDKTGKPICLPIPDFKTGRINDKLLSNGLVIDYNKLMQKYSSIKK